MIDLKTGKRLTRRDLLKIASVTFGGAALSASGEQFWLPRQDWCRTNADGRGGRARDAGGKSATRNDDKGWKNPYITDGLVMMYDGEWNAGPGKHDPNAQRWVDLSGNGIDLTPYYDSTYLNGPEWADDALKYNGRTFQLRATGLSYVYNALETAATVEAVYDFSSINPSGGQSVASFYLTTPTRLLIFDPANNNSAQGLVFNYKFYDWSNYGDSAYMPKGKMNEQVYGPHTANFTVSHPSGGNRGYVNNGLVCELAGRPSYYRTWDGFMVNSYSNTTFGKNHCIRVYTKPLTDAERAHNYEVDKARFGVA